MAIGGAAPAKKAARVERSRARNQEDRNVRPLLLLEEIALVRPNRLAGSLSHLKLINHWRDVALWLVCGLADPQPPSNKLHNSAHWVHS